MPKFTEDVIQEIFGHEAAENENPERLRKYYFKSKIYEKIDVALPLRILVGHKGIGKSALFQIAIQEDRENHQLPILIRPDDVAGLGKNARDFLESIRDWKFGLSRIIASKVTNSLGVSGSTKLDALQGYGGKLLEFLHETLEPLMKSKIDATGAKTLLVRSFLRTHKLTVYIDDLDRGWEGRKEDITRISALLNAVRDLSQENEGMRFRVALRSDVYFLVRTSDESTDKIEGSVIWYNWTNHEILALLVKRIETFFKPVLSI